MLVHKLSTIDAFVVHDLLGPDATPHDGPDDVLSIGSVRCAPKILQDGATWLARSTTYGCASFEIRAGGASAGINAKPDLRLEAIAAFDAEMASAVAARRLVLDPGKGVGLDDLVAINAADPRSLEVLEAVPSLLIAGILGSAKAVLDGGELTGRRIAVEGLDAMPVSLARTLIDAMRASGALLVGVSVAAGSVRDPAGLSFDAVDAVLADADATDVPGWQSLLGEVPEPANRLLGVDTDVLVVGSKIGALEHNGAAYVKASVVVPWGPVAVSAKALAVLTRAGVVVVPDFVALAGPMLSWAGESPIGTNLVAIGDAIGGSINEVIGHEHGAYLGACIRAESFLATWVDPLPFGRPLA